MQCNATHGDKHSCRSDSLTFCDFYSFASFENRALEFFRALAPPPQQQIKLHRTALHHIVHTHTHTHTHNGKHQSTKTEKDGQFSLESINR
mmetsp:Transcript_18834/g.39366  ORF Transcript_18834/g.39366 Transcript_18834/m.39366 type:complete len:91 (-) Transcript_18834:728-1000(-)